MIKKSEYFQQKIKTLANSETEKKIKQIIYFWKSGQKEGFNRDSKETIMFQSSLGKHSKLTEKSLKIKHTDS